MNDTQPKWSSLSFDLNKLIIDPQFEKTLEDIKNLNLSLPDYLTPVNAASDDMFFSDARLEPIGEIGKIKLNPKNGRDFINKKAAVAAYDESINRFNSLEGVAYFTSHSLVILGSEDYIPVNYLTFYFYTRSKDITQHSKYIKYSEDAEKSSQQDYVSDKINFLVKTAPENSVLFIDGPLIAGDVYTYLIPRLKLFDERNILPLFFVKNSASDLIVNSIDTLRGRYNSDLHWSYSFLREGERTSFFKYQDKHNPHNAKIFCYLKAFNVSPQRVEIHIDFYNKYHKIMIDLMDVVYYLILVQGEKMNPQVRPIAIAEKYARTTLNLININKIIQEIGVVPTMNQNRFGWS